MSRAPSLIAPDETRGDRAPPDIKGDGHTDGQPEKEKDPERGAAPKLLQGIVQDDSQGPKLPRNGLQHIHPEARAENAIALLEQGTGESGPAEIADELEDALVHAGPLP